MDIKIKLAKSGDAGEICTLVNSVYRGETAKKGWTTEADFIEGIRITAEKIKGIIEKKDNVIINALIEDKIIGCVHLEKRGNYALLGMLSVDVDYQNKGIGKILINECERYTKEVYNCNKIRMKVIGRRKELIEYYKRREYYPTGEREIFGASGDTFGVTKEKLYFEILAKKL
ncbi:MAG: GNAT family N-acetyltransferase [Chlorobi bacterium]|nr:GNAT family N-acetyltransferase [Chlorobiota bacterium]MCI0715779.1 GNAT family N-acetyltransferase [Chlorobiota bacterium]